MKKEYPKVNLKRQRGYPFVMVYVFAPDGTRIYTGDITTIHQHLSGGPTCHGIIVYYRAGQKIVTGRNSLQVDIFGKGAYGYRKQNYLSIRRMSRRDIDNTFLGNELAPFLEDRKKFLLLEHTSRGNAYGRIALGDSKTHVLGKWRNLPKTYLPEFKLYDATAN